MLVYVNDELLENGTAATWETGENTVRVVLTDLGVPVSPAIEYTVTVTKS